jgi:hypothetical protein
MIRCFFSQLLCILLVFSLPTVAAGKASNQEKQPTIQEQLVLMPPGTIVEVKTKSKEKFIGRLGALTAGSFELQIPKGKSIEKQMIGFDEVKSVKIREHFGMSRGGKTALWILAGAGILYLVLWLVIRQVPPMG